MASQPLLLYPICRGRAADHPSVRVYYEAVYHRVDLARKGDLPRADMGAGRAGRPANLPRSCGSFGELVGTCCLKGATPTPASSVGRCMVRPWLRPYAWGRCSQVPEGHPPFLWRRRQTANTSIARSHERVAEVTSNRTPWRPQGSEGVTRYP